MPIRTDSTSSELFDQEFLRKLQGLELLARQLSRSRQRAERRSVQRGSSIEFAEYRPFAQGDDERSVDWNVFARWRTLVLKLYEEEQDLPVYFLLDCSESMNWGQPLKFNHARQLVAGLGKIALSSHDRIALVPLGSSRNQPLPVGRGEDRFWHLLQLLSNYTTAQPAHSLEHDITRWLLSKPQRGLVILVTDLFGETLKDAFLALDRLRHSRHETAIIQITDPSEGEAGSIGEYELNPLERGESLNALVDSARQQQYAAAFQQYQRDISRYAREHQLTLQQTQTATPVIDLLIKTLRSSQLLR